MTSRKLYQFNNHNSQWNQLENNQLKDFVPNDTPSNIENLARAIKRIRPNKVQIYSVARIPAEYFVYAIDEERKKEITKIIDKIVQDTSIEINYY